MRIDCQLSDLSPLREKKGREKGKGWQTNLRKFSSSSSEFLPCRPAIRSAIAPLDLLASLNRASSIRRFVISLALIKSETNTRARWLAQDDRKRWRGQETHFCRTLAPTSLSDSSTYTNSFSVLRDWRKYQSTSTSQVEGGQRETRQEGTHLMMYRLSLK